MSGVRVGVGYDLHRWGEGGELVLGGIAFAGHPRLRGHSDGDVVLHALADAVLGAAAAGDIGRYFPPDDDRYRGMDSSRILEEVMAGIALLRWRVANADLTVIAEQPRIGPRVEEMRARIASLLGVDAGRVSVKGKTNEGVDAVGRGEAIACHAVVLLERAE